MFNLDWSVETTEQNVYGLSNMDVPQVEVVCKGPVMTTLEIVNPVVEHLS